MKRDLDANTLIRPVHFAHAVLRCRDLERSIEWYSTVIGMEIVMRNDMIAFMTYDHEHHRLALVQTPVQEKAPPGSAGLDHLAYTHKTLGDLLSTYKRLKSKGILPVWPINHGPTTSLYYEDPDGNRVEFQYEHFETEAELKGWFKSGAFEKNPIGIGFDPEKLVERYENGDPLEELIQQGSA